MAQRRMPRSSHIPSGFHTIRDEDDDINDNMFGHDDDTLSVGGGHGGGHGGSALSGELRSESIMMRKWIPPLLCVALIVYITYTYIETQRDTEERCRKYKLDGRLRHLRSINAALPHGHVQGRERVAQPKDILY